MKLKWPINNKDKRNERIFSTLRPYTVVIKEQDFRDFMKNIFEINPNERASAIKLLQHPFLMTR